MNRKIIYLGVVLCFVFTSTKIQATDQNVVPDHEYEKVEGLGIEGPKETQGIESSTVLGSIGLEDDFEALKGYVIRARRVVVSPGGTVAVHEHTSRPGVLYVMEGPLVEPRNDSKGPIVRTQGDTSFEKTSVIHWWSNESSEKAIALVVDIVPEDMK